MCKTTTPPHTAGQAAIRGFQPNTAAGAVIPLKSYLQKYVTQFDSHLVPATPPTLPSDVDPLAYKRVAFSILPLRSKDASPYYAGVFDDDTDFSASLLKVAALFAAGELLADAKSAAAGPANSASYNAGLKAEILANADTRIIHANLPAASPVGLYPKTANILTGTGPSADFTSNFAAKQKRMIVESDDPSAGFCIDQLGYGYISAQLIEEGFFDPATSVGMWLAGDYVQNTYVVRIPCVNDHPDDELTTSRQMCRLFSMIRLKLVPEHDLATNKLMQDLLAEPKTNGTTPWIDDSRLHGITTSFTIRLDKIGVAGLGTAQTPNVYSEGLVIEWDDDHQVDAFNARIDPGNSNPAIRLSGEFAVCWQNLMVDNLSSRFNGVVEVLNSCISDFLDQKAL